MTFNSEEKKDLISRLIKIAESDGLFHDEEYDLIHNFAKEQGLDSAQVELLFNNPQFHGIPNDEMKRILVIYMMFLTMVVDGEVSKDELYILNKTALKFAIPAAAIHRLIEQSDLYPKNVIPVAEVIKIFQIHHN